MKAHVPPFKISSDCRALISQLLRDGVPAHPEEPTSSRHCVPEKNEAVKILRAAILVWVIESTKKEQERKSANK